MARRAAWLCTRRSLLTRSQIPGPLLLFTLNCHLEVQISQSLGPFSQIGLLKAGRRGAHRPCNFSYPVGAFSAGKRPGIDEYLGKGQMGSALRNGVTANFTYFDRGTFWVFPFTYFHVPKSAQKCQGVFFHNLSKSITFASAPFVLSPFVLSQISYRTNYLVWAKILPFRTKKLPPGSPSSNRSTTQAVQFRKVGHPPK